MIYVGQSKTQFLNRLFFGRTTCGLRERFGFFITANSDSNNKFQADDASRGLCFSIPGSEMLAILPYSSGIGVIPHGVWLYLNYSL
jgi:hypothetical protein